MTIKQDVVVQLDELIATGRKYADSYVPDGIGGVRNRPAEHWPGGAPPKEPPIAAEFVRDAGA